MNGPAAVAMLSHMASATAPTGAERSLALLAEGLHRRGHRVAVAVPGPWVLADGLAAAGVEVVTVPSRPCWLSYWGRRPWPVVAVKLVLHAAATRSRARFRRFLSPWRPDVVHVNCLPQLHGAAAARTAGLPVVWHIREIVRAGPRRRWLARRLGRDASRIVAVSEATAAWIRDELPAATIDVVHNGVDIPAATPGPRAARAELGLDGDGVWVGFVGQVAPHKGAGLFADTAERMLARDGNVRFLAAGSGTPALMRRLSALAAVHPGRFAYLGGLPSGAAAIAASDIVCVPTLTPDPLPRSVLESMAAGRPVVASATGGIPEMVEDGVTGILLGATGVDELSGALTALAGDAHRRAAMSAAARARAAGTFSLDAHVDAMARVLGEAAHG